MSDDVDVMELNNVTIIHIPKDVDAYVVFDGELPAEVGQ